MVVVVLLLLLLRPRPTSNFLLSPRAGCCPLNCAQVPVWRRRTRSAALRVAVVTAVSPNPVDNRGVGTGVGEANHLGGQTTTYGRGGLVVVVVGGGGGGVAAFARRTFAFGSTTLAVATSSHHNPGGDVCALLLSKPPRCLRATVEIRPRHPSTALEAL